MDGHPEIGPTYNPKHAAEEKAKWAEVIGRFMVAFNHVDQTIDMVVVTLGSANLMDFAISLSVPVRCRFMKALVRDQKPTAELVKLSEKLAKEIVDLNEKRNLVAHNPPNASVRWNDENSLEVQIRLISRKNKIEISMAEIEDWIAQANATAMQVFRMLALIKGTGPWIPQEANTALPRSLLDPKK